MGFPSKNRRPARDFSWGEAVYCTASAAVLANQIVAVSSMSGNIAQVAPADGDTDGSRRLLIAKHDIPLGGYGICLPWKTVTSVNTAAIGVGGAAYLSVEPGAWDPVGAPTNRRQVGVVTISDATAGEIQLFGGYPASSSSVEDAGSVATASLIMSAQPTAADTIGIGADTYEFNGAGANINVTIGGSAAATRANLITAINTLGTEKVFADGVGTAVRIRSANARGGSVVGVSPNIVLAESITAAADVWDVGNVNMNTLAGEPPSSGQVAHAALTVTAAMITSGARVDFPFTPVHLTVQVFTSANVVRPAGADAFAIGDGGVAITFAGGGAPNIQATDVLRITVWS